MEKGLTFQKVGARKGKDVRETQVSFWSKRPPGEVRWGDGPAKGMQASASKTQRRGKEKAVKVNQERLSSMGLLSGRVAAVRRPASKRGGGGKSGEKKNAPKKRLKRYDLPSPPAIIVELSKPARGGCRGQAYQAGDRGKKRRKEDEGRGTALLSRQKRTKRELAEVAEAIGKTPHVPSRALKSLGFSGPVRKILGGSLWYLGCKTNKSGPEIGNKNVLGPEQMRGAEKEVLEGSSGCTSWLASELTKG